MVRKNLINTYKDFVNKYGISSSIDDNKILSIIKKALKDFMSQHSNAAIYCNGQHTEQLMAKFIFELRDIKYIIDNNSKKTTSSGYEIINKDQIAEYKIDGIIISSYKYRNEIKQELLKNYHDKDVLDLYEVLNRENISVDREFYRLNTPYAYYKQINYLQRKIAACGKNNHKEIEKLYLDLIAEYIKIKDFLSALNKIKECVNKFDININEEFKVSIENLYKMELQAASEISNNNVLMFCFDGLRNIDVSEGCMDKLASMIHQNAVWFQNAYSYSTSTFESLVPAYSENTDQRTQYYLNAYVDSEKCRFIQHAKEQNREIYFYDGGACYVQDESIHYTGKDQTVTEKIWDFITDAIHTDNGLFYLHEEDESHFSYVNPYTTDELLADGLNIMFDYLEKYGGALRVDYDRQHRDALRYLDDVVTPILQNLNCGIIIYADHGNLILDHQTRLDEIKEIDYSAGNQLIKIPFAIISGDRAPKQHEELFSLMDINNVIIAMLDNKKYLVSDNEFIKIGRSAIYNPDFKYLYGKADRNTELLAFEGFIFKEGWKLLIFSNTQTKLYNAQTDELAENDEVKNALLAKVKKFISVCK